MHSSIKIQTQIFIEMKKFNITCKQTTNPRKYVGGVTITNFKLYYSSIVIKRA